MMRSFKKMQGIRIRALDGEIGSLKDIYFDDSSWKIRYFVVELGSWFSGKDVLVPPTAVSPFDGISISVELTIEELRSCPHADSAIPVSLQQHYKEWSAYNLYCMAGNQMIGGPLIVPPVPGNADCASAFDPHLRSCRRVSDYMLVSGSDDIGAIHDLLIDDSDWMIRFFVALVNGGAYGGQKKLFSPQLIEDIVWLLSIVKIGVNRNEALLKPNFDAGKHLDTPYEEILQIMMCERYAK